MKNAIECTTGKDFITEEKLTPKERVKCTIGVVAGIEDFVRITIGTPEQMQMLKAAFEKCIC